MFSNIQIVKECIHKFMSVGLIGLDGYELKQEICQS